MGRGPRPLFPARRWDAHSSSPSSGSCLSPRKDGTGRKEKAMAVGPLPSAAQFQESVTFRNVSVNCTWEEWIRLDSAQRNLYETVMLEDRDLASLD
ncbi:Zinc finger protein 8 [Vulpes lagopus]